MHRTTKIYLKVDGEYLCEVQSRIKKYLVSLLFLLTDVISIESQKGYIFLKANYIVHDKKIFYLPNGYDPNMYKSYEYSPKEDIILTVWRLGIYQKNTELFLDIAKEVLEQFPHYKFYLVGTIEEEFQIYLEKFLKKNVSLQNNIIYIWEIQDRKKLIDLYKKSKFFLLTSRFDITPNVYAESWYFGNIIVTTDVGGAYDVTDNEKSGCVFSSVSPEKAVKYVASLIQSSTVTKVGKLSCTHIQKNFDYMPFIKKIFDNI